MRSCPDRKRNCLPKKVGNIYQPPTINHELFWISAPAPAGSQLRSQRNVQTPKLLRWMFRQMHSRWQKKMRKEIKSPNELNLFKATVLLQLGRVAVSATQIQGRRHAVPPSLI